MMVVVFLYTVKSLWGMRNVFFAISIIFWLKAWGCDISWKKLGVQTPYNHENVRPQGITQFKNKIILSNHYKDSRKETTSDLLVLNNKSLVIEQKLSFPIPFYHIGGLTSDDKYIYAVDFDNNDLLRINLMESIAKGEMIYKSILEIPLNGASGVAIKNNIFAVSDYIVPYRSPYFKSRFIRFFNLKSRNEEHFKGHLKSSNYSQGITFIKIGKKDYLLEAINRFESVFKYWITGKDYTKDIIRFYQIDFKSRKINFIKDIQIPLNMIEDLVWIGNNEILTTDEQNFTFYKGRIINCKEIM